MIIENKVAVVTGAASGIGRAVVAELVHRGIAAVAMVDRCDAVKQVAAGLNESARQESSASCHSSVTLPMTVSAAPYLTRSPRSAAHRLFVCRRPG